MNGIIKRKKDEGFTLIELMIVIAVIGILAIVLVPKVGTIKTQAKGAGIDTNTRMVQAYTQSRITSWASVGTADSVIAADLVSALSGGTDLMTNPFSGSNTVASAWVGGMQNRPSVFIANAGNIPAVGVATATFAGVVVVEPDVTVNSAGGINIFAYDSSGKVMADKTIRITP